MDREQTTPPQQQQRQRQQQRQLQPLRDTGTTSFDFCTKERLRCDVLLPRGRCATQSYFENKSKIQTKTAGTAMAVPAALIIRTLAIIQAYRPVDILVIELPCVKIVAYTRMQVVCGISTVGSQHLRTQSATYVRRT